MEGRLIIAYSLIALIAAFALGLVLWLRHNSFARADARRRIRDEKRYAEQQAGREGG